MSIPDKISIDIDNKESTDVVGILIQTDSKTFTIGENISIKAYGDSGKPDSNLSLNGIKVSGDDNILIIKPGAKIETNGTGVYVHGANEKVNITGAEITGDADFSLTNKVELGGYLYYLEKVGTNWQLHPFGSIPTPPTTPPITATPTPVADAGANYLNVGYLINYEENQTLMQRMGDLRNTEQTGDVWLRAYGGKFDGFSRGKLKSFDMGYHGMQLGGDKRLSDDIPLYLGLFIGKTDGSPHYHAGDGSVDSHYAGLYGTYIADNGFYSDVVLKVARQKNSFNVLDIQQQRVSASAHSTGFSVSIEIGKKFNLDSVSNGLYIEPQTQLTLTHQKSMEMKASNGLNITLGSYNSTLGRASLLAGYDINTDNAQYNLYLKTGFIREFSGNTDYHLNTTVKSFDFKGNGWNSGIGLSVLMDQRHTLYIEADYTNGNIFNRLCCINNR